MSFQDFMAKFFHLFDLDGDGVLEQDVWIEHLKGRLKWVTCSNLLGLWEDILLLNWFIEWMFLTRYFVEYVQCNKRLEIKTFKEPGLGFFGD